jgi:hypothetical protein
MANTGTKDKQAGATAVEKHGLTILHLDGCPALPERVELYEAEGPKGWVLVARCQDCAAHTLGSPTEAPSLEQEA